LLLIFCVTTIGCWKLWLLHKLRTEENYIFIPRTVHLVTKFSRDTHACFFVKKMFLTAADMIPAERIVQIPLFLVSYESWYFRLWREFFWRPSDVTSLFSNRKCIFVKQPFLKKLQFFCGKKRNFVRRSPKKLTPQPEVSAFIWDHKHWIWTTRSAGIMSAAVKNFFFTKKTRMCITGELVTKWTVLGIKM